MVQYIVANIGTILETFKVQITVSNGYIQGLSTQQVEVEAGAAGNGSFILKASSPLVIL